MDGTIKFYLAEGNSNTDGYAFADFYECENDDRITSITFPDDITHRRSDLYPWSRIIVGLNGNLKFMLIDLTEKDKPTLQTIELMIGDPSSPTVQPRALAVSPDGKFFLISGCDSRLFHFRFINRHVAAVTEIDLDVCINGRWEVKSTSDAVQVPAQHAAGPEASVQVGEYAYHERKREHAALLLGVVLYEPLEAKPQQGATSIR